jgi:hypothetical protein
MPRCCCSHCLLAPWSVGLCIFRNSRPLVTPMQADISLCPVRIDLTWCCILRPAWSVGLCILCFLLFDGYSPLLRALLENRLLAVLSRLTYAA